MSSTLYRGLGTYPGLWTQYQSVVTGTRQASMPAMFKRVLANLYQLHSPLLVTW